MSGWEISQSLRKGGDTSVPLWVSSGWDQVWHEVTGHQLEGRGGVWGEGKAAQRFQEEAQSSEPPPGFCQSEYRQPQSSAEGHCWKGRESTREKKATHSLVYWLIIHTHQICTQT